MSSEEQPTVPGETDHRNKPSSDAFLAFISANWAPRDGSMPDRIEAAPFAAKRRDAVSQAFPGERLVIPAGGFKVRSNDTDYRFRPHSAFAHLTGLGTDREPDAVLVLEPVEEPLEEPLEPDGGGHEAVIYFRPRAERDSKEFFGDARYGEFWVGMRPSLAEVEAELGITARHIDELTEAIKKDLGAIGVRIVRDADPDLARLLDEARAEVETETDETAETEETQQLSPDLELARFLSELRLVKDSYEIEQMRLAMAATAEGFEEIVRSLPDAVRRGRGERWVEGVFELIARHRGNGLGYDTIAAAGEHACTLHWIRNDGEVREGDLLLVDAGVEVDSLYTADVTRTVPINGTFSEEQRKVYDAVLAAQEAGLAAAKPGNTFRDVHKAAIAVIAEKLAEWGLLPVGVEEALAEEGQQHRRWMVHGTSHHLGLDVHDCALARKEAYLDGVLEPGMVLTVEPGLYFKADDLAVPEELRGIGVRIEDDIVITESGCENLSAALPRTADDVEAWMAGLRG
ncbi:MAG: aminopeptidase P family protein [Actinomycetota bacterium]|nr:aminopeptidase P family protein [Actinomycetota bacterium]